MYRNISFDKNKKNKKNIEKMYCLLKAIHNFNTFSKKLIWGLSQHPLGDTQGTHCAGHLSTR